MTKTYFFTGIFGGPEPGVRREAGISDARRGKPRLSNDRDYIKGHDLGLRLRGDRPDGENPTEPTPRRVAG